MGFWIYMLVMDLLIPGTMIGCGLMLPVSILSMVFLAFGRSVDTVGTVGGVIVGMQCAVMVLSIFPTERALKRNFDDYGRRK